MMRASAIVPAAGKGARFAASKPDAASTKIFADIDGKPMLERVVQSLLAADVDEVIVVLGERDAPAAPAVMPALADSRVRIVVNADPSPGMFSSIHTAIRAGLAGAAGDPLLILPADMPFVLPDTMRHLLAEYSSAPGIISPRFDGGRGHPILLPTDMRHVLLAAGPGGNLHDLLERCGLTRRNVDVADRGILRDVDVVSDLHT